MYPMTSDYVRLITNNPPSNLMENPPADWATQVFKYLENNFPEEIDNDGPRPFISSHACQLACFYLNFERAGTGSLV